jgi:hypothetical protein
MSKLVEGIVEYLGGFAALKDQISGGNAPLNFERWLLEHGEAMGPNIKRPKGVRLMQKKQCYGNSARSVMHYDVDPTEWFYCEGYAVSETLGLPLEHAWLANRKGEVIDRTWRKETGECAYYGIPFTPAYLLRTLSRTGYFGLFAPTGVTYNDQLMLKDDPADYRAWEKKA